MQLQARKGGERRGVMKVSQVVACGGGPRTSKAGSGARRSGISPQRRRWEEGDGGRRRTPRNGHGISGQRGDRMACQRRRPHNQNNPKPRPSRTGRSRSRVNRGEKERKGHEAEPRVGRSPK